MNQQAHSHGNKADENIGRGRKSSLLALILFLAVVAVILTTHVDVGHLFENPLTYMASAVGLLILDHLFGAGWLARKAGQGTTTRGRTIPWAIFYDRLVWLVTFGRMERLRNQMLQHAGVKAGERVLDVGCGTGDLALAAGKIVGLDGEVVGVDAAANMISAAKSKLDKQGSNVTFSVGLIEALEAEDNSFDLAMNSLVMHHLPPDMKQRALAEMHRILRPGGTLYIVDIEGSEEGSFWRRMSDLIVNLHGGHNAMRKNVTGLIPLLEEQNFQEIEMGRIDRQLAYLKAKK